MTFVLSSILSCVVKFFAQAHHALMVFRLTHDQFECFKQALE